jgi:hypothetical protein
MHRHHRRRAAAPLLVLSLAFAACSGDDDRSDAPSGDEDAPTTEPGGDGNGDGEAADQPLTLEAVSTRAEYVTGGDVLVELSGTALPDSGDEVSLTVDGAPVEVQWAAGDDELTGLVSGLDGGEHQLVASTDDADASLLVVDHPTTGPLFSGPHQPMPACSTEAFGLGEPVDEDCTAAAPVVSWSYVTTDGERVPLEDPTVVPDDADTLADGETPFILREEKGTLNRAVYWITVADPSPDPGDPGSWNAAAWNGRLVYEYGGGCGVTYSQGFRLLGEPDLTLLADGYAHATSTLNTFQVTCNAVVSAETTMVVKEHFSEQYAPPQLTIGTGGSGGAIQQYQIVQNYPGLLDASAALIGFPDAVSISTDVLDCGLLQRFGREGAGAEWSEEELLAVNGHLDAGTCAFWEQTFVPAANPTTGCTLDLLSAASGAIDGLTEGVPEGIEDSLAYDAENNPDGLRCTLQDGNVNILGEDPETGFARRPWDNVGVQYGLAALNEGAITVDQFIELNEGIGSLDIDGQWTGQRAEATEETMRIAYEAGAVNQGLGDLRRIPVISVNLWTDDQGDIHTRDRVFTVRERLRLADGTNPPNHMLWTRGLPDGETLVDSLTGSVNLGAEVVGVLDEWATAMQAEVPDRDGASEEDLLAALESTRPDAAIDNCVTADGERVSALDLYDSPGPCTDPYPISSTPRRVAGASLTHDILKCQLQPLGEAIEAGLYEVELTDDQFVRLESVFPDGVCDWTQPGVGQTEMLDTWRNWGE